MPELKDTPCDDWEDTDVNVSLISVFSVRLLNLSPHQLWDAYRCSDDSQEKKRLHDLENWAKLSVENQKN